MSSPTVPSGTPGWLLRPEVGLCPCGCTGRRHRDSFVERTIVGASDLVQRAMFADDTSATGAEAGGARLLQRIEPRVKLVTMLGLLLVASLVRRIEVLMALYAAALGLAAASGLPIASFVRRVWLFIPLFTGVVVLPATFSFVTAGDVVVPLGTWFGHPVGMTSQGLTAAALLVARVAVSISLVVLLTSTTPWNRLLGALRALAVPRVFVLVLAMAYRYVFHLLQAVADMYLARKARTAGVGAEGRSGRRFVSASAGALFGKSHALAEEVHQAMVARGYTGDVRTLVPAAVTSGDGAWALACAATAIVALGVDRALGG